MDVDLAPPVRSYTLRSQKKIHVPPPPVPYYSQPAAVERGSSYIDESESVGDYIKIGIKDVTRALEIMMEPQKDVETEIPPPPVPKQKPHMIKTVLVDRNGPTWFIYTEDNAVKVAGMIESKLNNTQLKKLKAKIIQLETRRPRGLKERRRASHLDLDLPSFRYLVRPLDESASEEPENTFYEPFRPEPTPPPDFHTEPHPLRSAYRDPIVKNSALTNDPMLKELYRPWVKDIYEAERKEKLKIKIISRKRRRLESQTLLLKIHPGLAFAPKNKKSKYRPKNNSTGTFFATLVIVCREDINPPNLADHVLDMIAKYNASCQEETPRKTYLVSLPKGSEPVIAQALGVKHASVISFSPMFEGSENLCAFLESHGISQPYHPRQSHPKIPHHDHLDNRISSTSIPSKTVDVRYEESHIKHLKISVPSASSKSKVDSKSKSKSKKQKGVTLSQKRRKRGGKMVQKEAESEVKNSVKKGRAGTVTRKQRTSRLDSKLEEIYRPFKNYGHSLSAPDIKDRLRQYFDMSI